MAYSSSYVVNYLLGKGMQVKERKTQSEKVITVINPLTRKEAYIFYGHGDQVIDQVVVLRVCNLLEVPLPPPER